MAATLIGIVAAWCNLGVLPLIIPVFGGLFKTSLPVAIATIFGCTKLADSVGKRTMESPYSPQQILGQTAGGFFASTLTNARKEAEQQATERTVMAAYAKGPIPAPSAPDL